MHTTGIFSHVAADAAHHLARWIRGVIKASAAHRPGHPTIDNPGLHSNALVIEIHRQHLTHAAGDHQQGRLFHQRPAGQPRATAAGHEGHPQPMAETQHGRHLLSAFRQHRQGR